MRIAISAGHGLHIRGAAGPEPWGLDEYDENVAVMRNVFNYLIGIAGIDAETFTDTTSTTQDENLSRLVAWHNNTAFKGVGGDDRLDVSIHFNAYETTTTTPHGTEVWYYSQGELAASVASEIAMASGLIYRGANHSTSLYFLNNTDAPAILIEVCFCDSKPDCDLYRAHFDDICEAIAAALTGLEAGERPPSGERPPITPPAEGTLFTARGPCSWFGGPDDTGVASDEGLAFLYDVDDARHLFLAEQPSGTTGLARRLDPRMLYIACRWDYEVTPKSMLADHIYKARVRNPASAKEIYCLPADWGPHSSTSRVCDLSPQAMEILDLETDDEVEITYPVDL